MQCTSYHNFLHKKISYLHALQGNGEMGARYLDPKYSRWISVDPALGEYVPGAGKANAKDAGGLPGMGGLFNSVNLSLFHYAGNNPVKYTDPTGMAAGDPFERPEDAAIDWAQTYADDSICTMCEYGSIIYSYVDESGTTKYSYNIPKCSDYGCFRNVNINEELQLGQTAVAAIHSHADYDPDFYGDRPSTQDKNGVMKKGFECEYLVTPFGFLYSFDSTGILSILKSDLPRDPWIDYPSPNISIEHDRLYANFHKDPYIDQYGRIYNK